METETQHNWHKVFESEEDARQQVPQRQLKLLVLEGKELCFAHTATGFFAIDDACPHMGHSLSRGTTNYLNEVICPWHSYRYNLETGRECDWRTRNARLYPVKINQDGVFIGIATS